MYFELMDTMSQPQDFPRAFAISGPFMMTVYLVVALASYTLGAGRDDLVASMEKGTTLRVVALLLFVHVAIVYLIKSVVLARYFHGLFHPGEVEQRTAASYFRHGGWGVAMLSFGFLVANAVPFFSHLLGLIGGLLAGPINFILPIVFYLNASGRHIHLQKSDTIKVEGACEREEGIITEYGTCTIDSGEEEESSITTSTTTTTKSSQAQQISRIYACCAAVYALPAWEIAMLVCTLVLTFLTIGLGFTDQVRQVLELQSQGAPFSCHGLAIGSSGALGCSTTTQTSGHT